MGLTMREKKVLTNEIAVRYRKESKIGKQAILDEFCRTTGYHRKYAVQVLNSWGKKKIRVIDGESIELVVEPVEKVWNGKRHLALTWPRWTNSRVRRSPHPRL